MQSPEISPIITQLVGSILPTAGHQGRFAGIIDFGEIRGADQLYDLGHFQIENMDLLPDLLAGYAEAQPLPVDYMRRILVTGLLIAVRRLGRRVARDAGIYEPDLRAIERTLRARMNP